MIIWVNGTFGAGKSATVRELSRLLPHAHVFEPELVGDALRRGLLPPGAFDGVRDLQDLVAWRRLVPETAAALLEQLPGGPLLVPMTLLRQDYRDEIFGAFAARRIPLHHVTLHCEETVLRARLAATAAAAPGTPGGPVGPGGPNAHAPAADGCTDPAEDTAVIDTTDRTPRQVAEEILALVAQGRSLRPMVHAPDTHRDTVAAAVLLMDADDRPLLVDPVYKPGWEFPGGIVENGEPPAVAAARELAEELGLVLDPAELRLLLVDWEPRRGPRSGGLRLVFDGGPLTPEQSAALRLPPEELRAHRFAAPEEWARLLPENKYRRLAAAVRARAAGRVDYLEAGEYLAAGPRP